MKDKNERWARIWPDGLIGFRLFSTHREARSEYGPGFRIIRVRVVEVRGKTKPKGKQP